MKRGTPDHPKVAHLAKLLNIPRAHAVGILEMLWHFTARYAPQGDIGRYSDKVIAKAVDWQRPTGERGVTPECKLSAALVEAKWLDSDPVHRLIVHDWAIHADQSVRRMLTRRRLAFVQPQTSLPEPEPEPEPVYTSSTPSVAAARKPEPVICAEDGFAEFRAAAEQYGISGSEPDWEEARRFAWSRLDFHSRLAAVRGIAERIQAGAMDDPARNALPKNYLLRRMWERKIRSPAAAPGKSEATAVALVGVLQRELQANDKIQLKRSGGGAISAGHAQVLALRPRDQG